MLSLSGAFTGGPAAAVVQDADTTKTGDDGLLLAAAPPPGGGTGPATTQVEWLTRQGENAGLAPFGAGFLGDQIDLSSGSLSFSHLDVSLPGNSGLEVALRRVRQSGEVYFGYSHSEFYDWQIDIPRVRTIVASPTNQPLGTWTNRCLFEAPPAVNSWGYGLQAHEYWNGHFLELPGQGSERIFRGPYIGGMQVGTTGYHRVECIADIGAANGGGEGFYITAPNGNRYRFDRLIYRSADPIMHNFKPLPRRHAILLATEVTDVDGNWVRYVYNSAGRPTRIHSNDGREITIAYSGDYISSVTANGRTWTYSYNGSLDRVTLPDGRYWEFDLGGGAGLNAEALAGNCTLPDQTITVRHPTGVTGTFTLSETRHGRTYVPSRPITGATQTGCMGEPYYIARHFDVMAVTQKQLSGPGYAAATWTYAYNSDNGAFTGSGGLSDNKWVDVTDPTGVRTRHYFNRRWGDLEGLETRVEVYANASSGSLVQTVDNAYEMEAGFGFIELLNDNTATLTRPRHLSSRTVSVGGETYTTTYTRNIDRTNANYSYGAVTASTASSSLGSGTRSVDTTYLHRTSPWVLALPTQVSRNGTVFETHGYDSRGRRTWTDAFGVRVADYNYNADGTLNWAEDALDRRTSFSSYHRGIPRSITLPDGATISGVVDNNGWITSVTNARGHTTGFSYNTLGWMTGIDRPSPFADTAIAYSNLGNGIVQTITRGSERIITTHDGFHRPLLVRRQALSGGGGNIYTRTQYDALGRATFTSFPSTSSNPTQGVTTSYDALGRITQSQENVAPYATTTTAYLSDNRTRVTDPEGNITTTTYSGYGSPDDGNPVQIAHPMGLNTAMTYDIWGNLLTARQYGSHNGYTVDHAQSWYYDARQRLCRHSVPESGDTLYAYDNANQTTGIARGQSAGTACSTLPAASRVTQVWDNRGRLDQVLYPDASPDVDYGYDANGNMTSAVRGTTSWAYQYNALDAITQETLTVDGLTFTTGYTRNADGYVTHQTTPAGRSVSYLPDGFGRATRVRVGSTNYAASASYHPSGGLAALSYGNGRALSMTYNTRQLVTDMTVSGGGTLLDFDYGYNANAHVTSIDDNVVAGQDRSFTYDDLNRLLTASGPWGSGSFVYDPLGNIRRQTLGSRVVEVNYNSANRVSQARDTGTGNVWRSYSYDSRGNTTSNGQLNWVYDRSEQPVTMTGTDTGSFVYDAHNRRVRQVINGETIYSVYTSSGAMVFRNNTTAGTTTDYLRLGGRTVVRLDQSGGATYTHADHLGSPVAATNASGTLLWREDYTPFGEARQQPAANDNGESYTGHIADTDTGLIYMQARYYDPAIGRFLSSDPVGFASGGPAYFNRYAYVANNPLNGTDPTGMATAPGDRFPTPEEAGEDAVRSENPTSIANNVELGGTIEREVTIDDVGEGWPAVDSNGQAIESVEYFATSNSGTGNSVSQTGSASTTVGIWHAHADYSTVDQNGNIVRVDPSLPQAQRQQMDVFDSENFSTTPGVTPTNAAPGTQVGDIQSADYYASRTSASRTQRGETFRSHLGTPSGAYRIYTPPNQ